MQTNHVPKLNMESSTTGCCPKFAPEQWDDKTFVFEDKDFVKASTVSFWHIPLNMGSVIGKTWAAIEAAGAKDPDEFVMLSTDVSPWKADHYFLVAKPVQGQQNVKFSGKFKTKVFEGTFAQVKDWYMQMLQIGQDAGNESPKVYFYYTTCPKCAKVYGKNYVVGFVEI